MARKIAIELEVNGVKESVKTIGELETAIESLTAELKDADIGSDEFNKLTNELNNARSELKAFELTFQGLEPQQKAQAYIAFGESVVSGILLAQEALRAFGSDNEAVNAAVEKSTQAINLALQARIVFEGALEARVIATTIAQRALNTSVVAGNTALKTLFTTMAANPLGAVLAVVGLLVTAFIALSDSAEDAATSTEKLADANVDAQKKIAKTAVELEFYASVVKDTTKSEEERMEALKELNKIGVITEDLTLDQVDALDKLNERLELARQNILLRAQAEAAASLLSKAFEEQLEAQNSSLEDNIGFWEKVGNSILSGGNAWASAYRNAQTAAENQAEATADATKDVEYFEKVYLEILDKLNKNEAELSKTRKDAKKDTDAVNKAYERFQQNIQEITLDLDKLNRQLLDFGETPSPKIIEDLETLYELQLQLIETSKENKKSLGDVFTDYTTALNDVNSKTDDFGKAYEEARFFLSQAFQTGDIEIFGKELEDVSKRFLDSEKFNKEQKEVVASLLAGYKTAFESLTALGVEGTEDFTKIVVPLLEKLTNKLVLQGDIQFEDTQPLLDRFGGLVSGAEVAADGFEIVRQQITDFIEEYDLSSDLLLKGTDEFYAAREKLVLAFAEEFMKQDEFTKLAQEDAANARKLANAEAQKQADRVIETITKTAEAEDAIRGVLNTFEDLERQVNNVGEDTSVLFGLILTNFNEFKEEFNFEDLLDPTEAYEKNFEVIEKFFTDIGAASIIQLYEDEEEKKEIVEFFLAQRQKLIEEAADKEKKTQAELLQETFDNYNEIVNGLSSLSLSLSEMSQYNIEQIEQANEEMLSNVVGDTKEAEALREEIQEDTNKKIVEIERKARLRELQFTKIQGIADLAQALINAQKLPPPFNVIQSGIVATAGGIQLATIEAQIQDLQSAQGFASGGFVSGSGSSTSDSIPAMLSNGEFVVNAAATQKFLPLLEEINNSERRFANGGFVLDSSFNSSGTLQNNFDDSRIISELRRNRQQPIRAYVFEKDITQAQEIEKRLQELSKL